MLLDFNYFIYNIVTDIGIKKLGLDLSKSIKLNYLLLNFELFLFSTIKLDILELNIYHMDYRN